MSGARREREREGERERERKSRKARGHDRVWSTDRRYIPLSALSLALPSRTSACGRRQNRNKFSRTAHGIVLCMACSCFDVCARFLSYRDRCKRQRQAAAPQRSDSVGLLRGAYHRAGALVMDSQQHAKAYNGGGRLILTVSLNLSSARCTLTWCPLQRLCNAFERTRMVSALECCWSEALLCTCAMMSLARDAALSAGTMERNTCSLQDFGSNFWWKRCCCCSSCALRGRAAIAYIVSNNTTNMDPSNGSMIEMINATVIIHIIKHAIQCDTMPKPIQNNTTDGFREWNDQRNGHYTNNLKHISYSTVRCQKGKREKKKSQDLPRGTTTLAGDTLRPCRSNLPSRWVCLLCPRTNSRPHCVGKISDPHVGHRSIQR